ncbi:hypothetical protein KXW04_004434, partial [Aspergillus fumigatus]
TAYFQNSVHVGVFGGRGPGGAGPPRRPSKRRARRSNKNHRPRPGHDRACKRSRVRIWLAGGPFCMGWSVRWPARPYKVGLSGSPVAWAARGLGHSRRLARAGPVGPRSLRPPAHRSPPRARPIARCGRARAPGLYRPRAGLSVWVSLDPVSVPGARRPTGHPRCLRVCRSASVCPWRAPLPAGGRPAQGAPANWSPCRPPARRPPPRQLGQPTGRRALACAPPPPPPPRPPRPPRPPFVALARATLCSPRGRAPTGPPAPLNRLPSTGTLARAAGGPSPTHTHRPRPAHHRARKRSRVRTSFRGEAHLRRQTARRPCGHVPQPTGHCPS